MPANRRSLLTAGSAVLLAVLMSSALSLTAVAEEPEQAEEASVADLSADDLAERVQHFYGKTEDFQAAFLQSYTDIAAGQTKRSRGRVYFKKPGMMRWDYYDASDDSQRERMLVSDGSKFWIYEFEYQQVFRQCLEDSQLPTTLRFLMGEGELTEDFEIERIDDGSEEQPKLELTPNEPTSHYRKLQFVLDPETFQVVQTTVFDPYGNTNQIDFQNIRVNRNLPDSGFEFETPEGARELNPQKRCD